MIANCTAVILAGGQSKRMGQDKASMLFEGQTLLARAEQRLAPLFEHVVVSVREPRSDTDLPQVLDSSESRAPMMGIVAAMQAVKTDWVFVVGVDMPFISAELVQYMATQRDDYDGVALFASDMPQPLCCCYHQRALPMMQKNMQDGKRSLKHLLQELDTHFIFEAEARLYDAELQSLISLNTAEDVAQWSKT